MSDDVRPQPFAKFLPPETTRDGWGQSDQSSSDFAAQGLIPCMEHPPGQPPYPGTHVCSACVALGLVTIEQATGAAGAQPIPEVDQEFERVVNQKLALERQENDLRRREIDFAIRSRDVARLHALGAGEKTIAEIQRLVAAEPRDAGEPEPAGESPKPGDEARLLEEPVAPSGRIPVGESRPPAQRRTADDPGGALLDGRDHNRTDEPARGLRTPVARDRAPAGTVSEVESFGNVELD